MFQCKRYIKIDKTTLKNTIDKIIINNLVPDVLVLIVSSNLGKRKSKFFESYAKEHNIKEIFIWTKSILEMKLYSDYTDLLNKYFEISIRRQNISKAKEIKDTTKKREKFKKDFLEPFDPEQPVFGKERFISSDIIICNNTHSLYEDQENKQDEFGWWSYFKVEPQNVNDDGIEVIFSIVTIIIDEDGYWDFCEEQKIYDSERFVERNFFKVGLVTFGKIDFWDIHSSWGKPILFCKYNGNNGPFDKIFYRSVDNEFFILDENLKL